MPEDRIRPTRHRAFLSGDFRWQRDTGHRVRADGI